MGNLEEEKEMQEERSWRLRRQCTRRKRFSKQICERRGYREKEKKKKQEEEEEADWQRQQYTRMYLEEELQRQKIISSPTGNFSIRGILMCQRKPLRQNIITATRGNHCVTRRFFSNRRKLLLRCIGFAIEVSQGYFFVGKVKAFEFMEKMLIGR